MINLSITQVLTFIIVLASIQTFCTSCYDIWKKI